MLLAQFANVRLSLDKVMPGHGGEEAAREGRGGEGRVTEVVGAEELSVGMITGREGGGWEGALCWPHSLVLNLEVEVAKEPVIEEGLFNIPRATKLWWGESLREM